MSDASDFSAATGASTVELPVSRVTDRLVIRHHPRFTTIGPSDGGERFFMSGKSRKPAAPA